MGCPQNQKFSASDFQKTHKHKLCLFCCKYFCRLDLPPKSCTNEKKQLPPLASLNFPPNSNIVFHRPPVELRFGTGVVFFVDVSELGSAGHSFAAVRLLGTALAFPTLNWEAMGQRVGRRRGLTRTQKTRELGFQVASAEGIEMVFYDRFLRLWGLLLII